MKNKVIQELAQLRERKGITTYQLAELTGMQRTLISRILNGRSNPTLESLETITAALGATIKIIEKKSK